MAIITVKEQVVREAIKRVNKRLLKINSDLNCEPLSRVIEIRIEAQELLDSGADRTSIKFVASIIRLAKEEKQQLNKAKRLNKNHTKMITEQADLESELRDLNRELYFIENS